MICFTVYCMTLWFRKVKGMLEICLSAGERSQGWTDASRWWWSCHRLSTAQMRRSDGHLNSFYLYERGKEVEGNVRRNRKKEEKETLDRTRCSGDSSDTSFVTSNDFFSTFHFESVNKSDLVWIHQSHTASKSTLSVVGKSLTLATIF